jgi:twitching motility protein PilJ
MQNPTTLIRTLALVAALSVLAALALLLTGRGTGGGQAGAAGPGPVVALQATLLAAREALHGAPQSFEALDKSMAALESVGEAGLSEDLAVAAGQLRSAGSAVQKARADIVAAEAAASDVEKLALEFSMRLQELRSSIGPSQPVAIAQLGRLKALVDGLAPQLRGFALGPLKPTEIANQLGQTESESSQILLGLQMGDSELGLRPLTGGRSADILSGLAATKDRVFGKVRDVRARADRLDLVQQAARQLDGAAARLLAPGASEPTPAAGSSRGGWLTAALLGVAVLALLALAWLSWRGNAAAQGLSAAANQSDRNQQAILRLLDELSSLADGDLTVQATVTEDITGAIADSINYAVEALRGLVTTINESAILLDGAAQTAESTGRELAQASDAQSRQVESASQSIARMAGSIEEVSGDAERSSDVARHSVDVAHKGGDAVRRTIEGMNAIRETIQETSKRIKRLGESSQEIGNIVELINDIADQTNILALNASIQASMAGEAGRGFAVVADEVQRLAERSANATKQIEVLVRTIQADTNEAIVSMERSTTDVVGGALLAENAGAALEEIEQVSNQIASLVQNISSSAREQAGAAAAVIRNVEGLQQINSQTAAGTNATMASIKELAQLAADLRRSVAGFRLPAGGPEGSRARPAAGAREGEGPGTGLPGTPHADELSAKRRRVAGKKTA